MDINNDTINLEHVKYDLARRLVEDVSNHFVSLDDARLISNYILAFFPDNLDEIEKFLSNLITFWPSLVEIKVI